jgi:hypothetical protein
LLDLDRLDCPLGLVVGEDLQVRAGGKAEDEVFEGQEPAGDAAGIIRGGGARYKLAASAPAVIAR